jgi:hypothetical protein
MVESSKRSILHTAALDFGSIAANADAEIAEVVGGARVGDVVTVSCPTLDAGLVATAFVSGVEEVTVRVSNVTTGAVEPGSVDAVQRILHDHTGGTFTISFDGQGPTGTVTFDNNGTGINTELELLSNIVAVTVAENATGDWNVTFTDPGGQPLPLMTVDGALLTGGTTIDVTTVTPGVDAVYDFFLSVQG